MWKHCSFVIWESTSVPSFKKRERLMAHKKLKVLNNKVCQRKWKIKRKKIDPYLLWKVPWELLCRILAAMEKYPCSASKAVVSNNDNFMPMLFLDCCPHARYFFKIIHRHYYSKVQWQLWWRAEVANHVQPPNLNHSDVCLTCDINESKWDVQR